MTDAFSAPAAGGKFSAKDHNGALLLITPTEYRENVETTFGKKDAVAANVVVIDEKNVSGSEEIADALIFGGVLIGQTKSKIGKGMILGRLGQKPTDKGNPAWVLADPTDAEKDVARAYLATKAPQL
jgi:hypothetical protein